MRKDETRKKVEKIHKQIGKVALKGKDYKSEYHRVIDGIVQKGDYAYLEMCLSDKYGIEASKYESVDALKNKSWKLVLEQTDSSFISKLRSLYKSEGIYQQGNEIRSFDPSYSIVSISGPYLAEEAAATKARSSDIAYRTKYVHSGTQSQISASRKGEDILIGVVDPSIFSIDIRKVIWATFSAPIYVEYGATSSSASDLVVMKLRERQGSSALPGGVSSTAAVRINDVRDHSTKSSLTGAALGQRIEIRLSSLFGSSEDILLATGIEQKGGIPDDFEAEIVQIKKLKSMEFQSPYETSRISSIIAAATQSGATYSSRIPVTHGGEYLLSTKRRGYPGWASPEYRYEELFYRISVKKENLLGTIREVEDYQQDPKYLSIKSRYASYLGMRKTYLEVHKNGYDAPVFVVYENYALSEESNLFARYKLAIQYLNS